MTQKTPPPPQPPEKPRFTAPSGATPEELGFSKPRVPSFLQARYVIPILTMVILIGGVAYFLTTLEYPEPARKP